MPLRLNLEIPYPGESFPLAELKQFIDSAVSSGVAPDAIVQVVPTERDDSLIDCFRIEITPEGAPGTLARPAAHPE